ncbi:hypothetical protein [Endozoicomonas numazuensis]|uniref:Uncharacterized protein n=1 Tax=Endozoicomonas numazuensis TaxID=1137799 RepID=A0A081NJC2_9GAMM|nr:hypothetical protein [Endozoicomonas numazuensis]KEQ18545.1 hypothetical protein GZ78_13840 [Endozoicomonas numazuensis]
MFNYRLLLILLLSLKPFLSSADTETTQAPETLDFDSMQSCYKQFTSERSTIIGNYYRRRLRSINSVTKLPAHPISVPPLSPETSETCADIFKTLHSSALAAFDTPGRPNLFPREYYEFLMDQETIKIVRNLLEGSEPTVAPSTSITPDSSSTQEYTSTLQPLDTTALVTATPTLETETQSVVPTATPTIPTTTSTIPTTTSTIPTTTPTTTPTTPVVFSDDQIKGFIFNLSHYLVSYLSGGDTPTFCGSYHNPFVEEDAEGYGCRAIAAKFFIQNLKSSQGQLSVYTWYQSPGSISHLNQWLDENASIDDMLPPIVAVFQNVELNTTLDTQFLGGLVGIPDLRKGTFDPTTPFANEYVPTIKGSGQFQSACETFQPETLPDVNCSGVGSKNNDAKSGNALISLGKARVSGVNFEAALAPVTLEYTYHDSANGQADARETFPAVMVMAGLNSGNSASSLLINSKMKIHYRPEVVRKLKKSFLLESQFKDNSAPEHKYDVYAFSLYNWVDQYIITQNTLSVETCDTMTLLYDSPVQKASLHINKNNIVQDFNGNPCHQTASSTIATPTPSQTPDAPSGASETMLYVIIIAISTTVATVFTSLF